MVLTVVSLFCNLTGIFQVARSQRSRIGPVSIPGWLSCQQVSKFILKCKGIMPLYLGKASTFDFLASEPYSLAIVALSRFVKTGQTVDVSTVKNITS